jgi:hypothetical protein
LMENKSQCIECIECIDPAFQRRPNKEPWLQIECRREEGPLAAPTAPTVTLAPVCIPPGSLASLTYVVLLVADQSISFRYLAL